MQIHIEAHGLAEATARFAQAPAIVRSELEPAMQRAVLAVQRDVQELTPVRTGTLRRSIHGAVQDAGRLGKIGTNLIYAPFIELGQRRGKNGTVYRRAGPAAMFRRGGEKAKTTVERIFTDAARRIAARLGG